MTSSYNATPDVLDGSFLQSLFPYCSMAQHKGMTIFTVPVQRYTDFCCGLKDAGFRYLSGITAVDRMHSGTIDLVGHAYTIPEHQQVQFVVSLDRSAPEIDSVVSIWPTADWHEREAFDMFGIVFRDHPNLTRILLTESFVGHPLRKDFIKGVGKDD